MRLFRRAARPTEGATVAAEFRVGVRLHKGDRLVYRDARGTIDIIQATESAVELVEVGGIGPRPAAVRRRPAGLRRWVRTTAGALA